MDKRFNEMGVENELATILSHYSPQFIYDIMNDQINRIKTSNIPLTSPPNVVAAWEANFRAISAQYGSEESPQIKETREETYNTIIDIICNAFNLNYTISNTDPYTSALILYDFFICNLNQNIIQFFSRFIYNERDSLYESLGLSELKKNKDSSTLYAKRMYKDIRLAVMIANITKILNQICNGMEFDFYTFASVCVSPDYMDQLINLISEKGNFFAEVVVPIINSNLAEYVTGIRLAIQEIATSSDQVIYSVESEGEEDVGTSE